MSTNPQFIRTDKAIKQALITLLKTKPFEKITVQDILDETPVTRSTFYKHYHDKYEIAEKMQAEFIDSLHTMRKLIRENPNMTPATIKVSQEYRELMEALLKIHTEHVNLRKTLADVSKEHYLLGVTGEYPVIESEVFASCVTAFHLSEENNEQYAAYAIEYMHDVFISVALRVLGIPEDEEMRKLLKKKAVTLPIN